MNNVAPDKAQPALLLTVGDLAHELRASVRTVHRLLASGRLYASDVQLGGKRGRRWRRDRLEAWIRASCPAGVSPPTPAN